MSKKYTMKVVANGVDTYTAFVPDTAGYEVDGLLYHAYEEARLALEDAHEDLMNAVDKESNK